MEHTILPTIKNAKLKSPRGLTSFAKVVRGIEKCENYCIGERQTKPQISDLSPCLYIFVKGCK